VRDCNYCGETRSADEMVKDRRLKSGLSSICKSCQRAYNARRPKPTREQARRWKQEHTWRAQGIDMTADRYEAMLQEQDGLCFLCGRESFKRNGETISLAVDHCHETGATRRLLCTSCNVTLGKLERAGMFRKVVEYLRDHDSPAFKDAREALAAGWEPRL
jgi:hypothetical protein